MLKYRPDIDGLRALAVIPVILFHLHSGFPGGFAGVDVFFVISGFLITGVILHAQDEGRFSLLKFWQRRILRLFPAFIAVTLATLIFGYFYFLPNDYLMLTHAAFAQLFAMGNIYFWMSAGYFSPVAEFLPLLHTWSLAVEEQFYLFLPLFMAFVGLKRRNAMRHTLLAGGLVSLALCCWLIHYDADMTFYLLPTRAWEMMLGACLVLYSIPLPEKRWLREGLSFAGLVGLGISYFAMSSKTLYPGAHALLPCVSTAILLHVNRDGDTAVARFLSFKPIVFIGLISYSLYLWHWPLLCFLRYALLNEILTIQYKFLYLIVVGALSVLSWRFIETPFRTPKASARLLPAFAYAGGITASLLAFCVFVHVERGWAGRLPQALSVFHDVGNREYPLGDRVHLDDVLSHSFPILGVPPTEDDAPHFLLWGDSHAGAIVGMLDRSSRDAGLSGVASFAPESLPLSGVFIPSAGEELLDRNRSTLKYVLDSGVSNVVLVARWSIYTEGNIHGDAHHLLTDTHNPRNNRKKAHTLFEQYMLEKVNVLTNAGVKVWIMKQVPTQEFHVPQIFGAAMLLGKHKKLEALHIDDHHERNEKMNSFLDSLTGPNVTVLDPLEQFQTLDDRTHIVGDGVSLYRDEDHLSEAGADLLEPLYEPLLNGDFSSQVDKL